MRLSTKGENVTVRLTGTVLTDNPKCLKRYTCRLFSYTRMQKKERHYSKHKLNNKNLTQSRTLECKINHKKTLGII